VRSCAEEGIGFGVTLHAFENEAAFDPMALYHREFLLAGRGASPRPQAVDMVVHRRVQTLRRDEVAATTKYLIEMADRIGGAEYDMLASHVVVAMGEISLTRRVELGSVIVATVQRSADEVLITQGGQGSLRESATIDTHLQRCTRSQG
jgi:hypothetical protein